MVDKKLHLLTKSNHSYIILINETMGVLAMRTQMVSPDAQKAQLVPEVQLTPLG